LGHLREGLPWVEKYRPSALDDILAHEDIIQTIKTLIQQNKMPHLLFYGPPGTGKTTTILACARMLYGANFQNFVMELNASDDRGIGIVRNQIKDFASTKQIFSSVPFKLIILDEADQMTNEAQAALRRVIEKFTRNVRFCFVCNHVNKISAAVQSRCTRFRFGPLKKAQVMDRLHHIVKEESIEYTEEGLNTVVKLSQGDMRKCINILQATYNSANRVHEDDVYACTGQPCPADIRSMVDKMVNNTFSNALREVRHIKDAKGLSIADVLSELAPYVMRMQFSEDVKMYLFESLADIEYQLVFASGEKMQISALVGAFQIAKVATLENKTVAEVLRTDARRE
jgi:replication factor C subunit 3/5